MRNIYKKSILVFSALVGLASCSTNDKEPIATANGFALNEPATGMTYTLTPQTAGADLLTLTWDQSNNGVAASPSYTVEIAKSGTNFANPINAVASSDLLEGRSYTWKTGYFNSLLNQIGFNPCSSLDVDVRIKSTLGIVAGNALVQYSTPITINVTPYITDLPLIAFSSTSTITSDTPKMAASGILNSDYEGYMWLNAGSYKFYKPNNSCNLFDAPIAYGDDNGGSFNTLVANGSGYDVSTAGYYLVKADLATSIYSVRPVIWNLYGSGKQTFTGANTAMAYDQTAKVWRLNITLANGYGFKFRSNGTALTLVKYLPATVNTSDYGGSLLSYVIPGGGLTDNELAVPGAKTNPKTFVSYDVVLDLSTPRDYKYTITAQ